jgi:hypothetical protein
MLLRELVYWAVVQKRPWYIRPFHGRCVATALHATIHISTYKSERDNNWICLLYGFSCVLSLERKHMNAWWRYPALPHISPQDEIPEAYRITILFRTSYRTEGGIWCKIQQPSRLWVLSGTRNDLCRVDGACIITEHVTICRYRIVTSMARTLLGNGPVNTPLPNTHKATMEVVSQWKNVIALC